MKMRFRAYGHYLLPYDSRSSLGASSRVYDTERREQPWGSKKWSKEGGGRFAVRKLRSGGRVAIQDDHPLGDDYGMHLHAACNRQNIALDNCA
jgi:hypothetical protein